MLAGQNSVWESTWHGVDELDEIGARLFNVSEDLWRTFICLDKQGPTRANDPEAGAHAVGGVGHHRRTTTSPGPSSSGGSHAGPQAGRLPASPRPCC